MAQANPRRGGEPLLGLLDIGSLREFRASLPGHPAHKVAELEAKLPAGITGQWWDRLEASCRRVNEAERTGEIKLMHGLEALQGYDAAPERPKASTCSHEIPANAAAGVGRWRADPLRRIRAAVFYSALTGEPVSASGWALCVFHDDHNPSLRCRDNRWRCFACGTGGSIIDLGSFLFGLQPRGQDFLLLRKRLAEALLARKMPA